MKNNNVNAIANEKKAPIKDVSVTTTSIASSLFIAAIPVSMPKI